MSPAPRTPAAAARHAGSEAALGTAAAVDALRERWLAAIKAIPDPALRLRVAVAELAAAEAALRAIRDQALAELYEAIGRGAGGGWEEVGKRLPGPDGRRRLTRSTARKYGRRAPDSPTSG